MTAGGLCSSSVGTQGKPAGEGGREPAASERSLWAKEPFMSREVDFYNLITDLIVVQFLLFWGT